MAEIKGGQQLENVLKNLAKQIGKAGSVKVGFLEGATYPDGTSVAMVASIQEFGAPSKGIPPRPFFRTMIAKNAMKWPEALQKILQATDKDTAKALALMGEGIAGQLRKSIVDLDDPPLSAVTVLLRSRFPDRVGMTFDDVLKAWDDVKRLDHPLNADVASDKPLVWTGHLLASVDYEVSDPQGNAIGDGRDNEIASTHT